MGRRERVGGVTVAQGERLFGSGQALGRRFGVSDLVVVIAVGVVLYAGVRLAFFAPTVTEAEPISLAPTALPIYAAYSVGRMAVAYVLSLFFTLVYGYVAAYNRRAEMVLMPLLDVLQSVPILSFLPVVLLSLSALLPQRAAVELASIVLIFTSQVWNLTFGWYQSLTTIPVELREASTIFRFNRWLRLKTLELPSAANSLVWNSMMSWAGGWFFLMAAEIFTVGQQAFHLPGLGAYLHEAADQADLGALAWGLGALILVIVALDQFIWRPLLAWAVRFRVGMVESEAPPRSWFYDALNTSRLVGWWSRRVWGPADEWLDARLVRPASGAVDVEGKASAAVRWLLAAAGALLLYGVYRAAGMMLGISATQWAGMGVGLLATLARVTVALAIALAWTIPVGVAIGTNPRLATWLQPLVQVTASVPATALFPVLLLLVLQLPGGLNLAAVLLMLMGTQWYLLFNIIAGATAIPQDLKYTVAMLGLSRRERWRTLILPGLFPYIVTGAITATGGAWNASIVAEYMTFGGEILSTVGIGSTIAQATAEGDYPLLLAATLVMILTVMVLNRLLWRRLYRLAEERYRME